ncbi:MAG TPA: 30S ribosomal protein S27e [Nitrososphaeraceae archaeon]|jgi:small subunit ribosomal protein S27e|nr:30S ribosomal protein S27e [Nitrososphaeraceae archaeon]
MRKDTIMIPKPRSNFLSVQCTKCEEQKVIFSHTTMDLFCKSCGELIAKKTGARANILGKIINTID